jgi:hypothetical protein
VQELKTLLEDNAPYQAKVTFESAGGGATGWNAPTTAPWFEQALNAASLAHFGAPVGYIGQGGTIPLMNMLQQGLPEGADDGLRRARPAQQRARPERVPARALRQALTAAVAEVMAQMP